MCSDLPALNQQINVFLFKSIMLVKRRSYFLSTGLLTGVWFMVDLGLLLVNPSGIEIIAASRKSLNICWSLHFPECWYDLLIFWRHLCLKEALFLNDWSIKIALMWYLGCGYCNITLITKHFCSNVSIKKHNQSPYSISLIQLTWQPGHIYHQYEITYNIYQRDVISKLCVNWKNTLAWHWYLAHDVLELNCLEFYHFFSWCFTGRYVIIICDV